MEIELYSKLTDPMSAITQIGNFFAKSGMFGCDRAEQGQVLAMVCLAERKSPVEITRTYDIVEGKLRKKALAALAEFRAAGGKHKWIKSGDEPGDNPEAILQLTDKDGNSITYSYSLDDAKAEKLVRDNSRWTKRPGNMLRARCISNGLGMLCPEIYAGEDDRDPTPGPEIKLESPAEPKPAVVLEVVTSDEKELADKGLAPIPSASPESNSSAPAATSKPFAVGPAYTNPKGHTLPADLLDKVVAAIGNNIDAAQDWMLKQGWITSGQGIHSITESRARRILNSPDTFIRAITS